MDRKLAAIKDLHNHHKSVLENAEVMVRDGILSQEEYDNVKATEDKRFMEQKALILSTMMDDGESALSPDLEFGSSILSNSSSSGPLNISNTSMSISKLPKLTMKTENGLIIDQAYVLEELRKITAFTCKQHAQNSQSAQKFSNIANSDASSDSDEDDEDMSARIVLSSDTNLGKRKELSTPSKQKATRNTYSRELKLEILKQIEEMKAAGISMARAVHEIHKINGFERITRKMITDWEAIPGRVSEKRGRRVNKLFEMDVLSELTGNIVTLADFEGQEGVVIAKLHDLSNMTYQPQMYQNAALTVQHQEKWAEDIKVQKLMFSDKWVHMFRLRYHLSVA